MYIKVYMMIDADVIVDVTETVVVSEKAAHILLMLCLAYMPSKSAQKYMLLVQIQLAYYQICHQKIR